MLLIFLSAFAVGFSGAVMPGPLLTYTIRKSLTAGPVAGVIIIAGHAILEVSLVAAIFLGFDVILKSEIAQTVIGMAGGALLSVMGANMLIGGVKNKVAVKNGEGSLNASSSPSSIETDNPGSMIFSSIILTASNPYFIIWWAVIGLGFIMQSFEAFGAVGVAVYYIGHITADLTWYALVSTVVGKSRKFIRDDIYRVIICVLGCVLIFFGIRFIITAAQKLL